MTETKNQFQLTWLPKKTFEVLAIVPWEEIKRAKELAIKEAEKKLKSKDFGKGMPRRS